MSFSAPFYHTDEYRVSSYHADRRQRLQLTSLMHFLQETAWRHASANRFGFDDLKAEGCFWVLSRLEVQVRRYPLWNDALQLRTWSKQPGPLTGNRDFELLSAQGEALAVASTTWLVVDLSSRRPLRLERFGSDFPHVLHRHAIAEAPAKLPAAAAGSATPPMPILLSDIDLNGHVNNACYVRWCLDSPPFALLDGQEIKKLEVNFLHEAHAGERYTISAQSEAASCLCSVARSDDGKELARVRVSF
jgi:medium-chain acyl-[acyl-carrier-protein] hydrolase